MLWCSLIFLLVLVCYFVDRHIKNSGIVCVSFSLRLFPVLYLIRNFNNYFLAYFPIMVLPRGARTIQIAEEALSRNYLAVRDIYGKYYLNGNWHLNSNGAYSIAGAKFIYKRSYIEPEILQSDGPLLEDVVLEV